MKISVSSLINYLKNKLDTDTFLHNILVEGEISNFHRHYSGHIYFTLKDEKAQIACVMFRYKASQLKFLPKNGDKVLVKADASVFESSGQLQLLISEMKPSGIGELMALYEQLKKQLASAGYFNDDHKKTKPNYPLNIAVLVGDKSAAMSDIKICFQRRWPLAKTDYYPCLVQGKEAAADIINQLIKVDSLHYDAIILARGGGSFEDLFCFNDEELVKTIYNLNTFIITGIGHEQDFTLSDFVADLRAATPTAAVEILTPNITDLLTDILSYKKRMIFLINNSILNNRKLLNSYLRRPYFSNPYKLIDKANLKLNYLETQLAKIKQFYLRYINQIINYRQRIFYAVDNIIKKERTFLNYEKEKMYVNITYKEKENKQKLKRNSILLKAYSLQSNMLKGYALIYRDNKLIKRGNDLKNGDEIEIHFIDTNIKAEIKR